MDEPECPLCLEPLAIDDINFYPCVCRYQICRFCWHRIRMDEGGKCPHCRTVYSENPAEYNPPSPEQISQLKSKGKKKSQDRKQKIIESRKNLTDVRVLQKNLIFVLGLSPRLADPEILKKPEYFGKYGKIHKVVLNHHTIYNGSLGPSVSAYVTYQREEDALRAMQAVNNAFIDGRILKASFGTTKYCSFFLRGLQCTKPDCMYLHELGDTEASFTKEDMQQGKHQDYEIATLESQSITINKEYPPKKSTRGKQGGSGGSGHNKINSNKTAPPAESALPSTSNWGSKGDKPRKKVHKQLSVPHSSEPRPLQRTLSNPSSRSNEDPHSLSTSPASSISLEGRREKGRGGGGGGRGKREGDNVEEDESQYHFVSTSSQCSDVTTDFDEEPEEARKEGQGNNRPSSFIGGEEEEEEEGGYDDIEEEEEGEKVEEKSITWKRNDDDDDTTTLDVFKALGVSPMVGHDFGNLGVSWSRDPPPPPRSSKLLSQRDGEDQLSSPPPLSSSSPVFMSMPWEVPHESSTNTLTDLLSTNYRISPPLMSKGLVDERQRLASASYVNYGPTTNNHLDELHTKGSIEAPRSSLLLDNKTDSFQSSLDDGFQSLFPAGAMQSLENALQVTSLDVTSSAPPSSSSKLFSLFQNPSPPSSRVSTERKPSLPTLNLTPAVGHFDSSSTNGEWPKFDDDNNKQKGAGTTIAPPPGFGNCKPFPKATPTSAYTLWGEGTHQQSNKDDKSSSLVQAPLPAAPGSRPVPIGAIQHNLLEASLFNSSSPNSSSSFSLKKTPEALTSSHHIQPRLQQQQQHLLYTAGSSPHGNKPPLLPQPMQPVAKTAQQHNLKQQQQRAMLLRQQQQQQYQKHQQVQLAAIQQQMFLYQQQVLAHQQASGGVSQKRPSSSYPPAAAVAVPQSTAANNYKSVPVPHQTAASNPHPTPLYFGGWYPAYATWGLPAAPGLAVAPGGHNVGRLAGGTGPGLQGSRSVTGVTGVLGQQQGVPSSGSHVEQKFQNTTLN